MFEPRKSLLIFLPGDSRKAFCGISRADATQ